MTGIDQKYYNLANWLSHYLYFFSFLFLFITTRWSAGKCHVTLSQCHNGVTDLSQMVTVCHMTRVTWGPWENKCIATVVKCISSRELSENPIEFSLSNSEQRDSWLNSGHRTLDADKKVFLRALSWLWDRGNCWRIGGDMTKWSVGVAFGLPAEYWHFFLFSFHFFSLIIPLFLLFSYYFRSFSHLII